jgi:hypothetical protein
MTKREVIKLEISGDESRRTFERVIIPSLWRANETEEEDS